MKSTLGFVFFCFVLTAYYIYIPLPHTISEPWKLMMLDATFRGVQRLGNLAHSLGLSHHIRVLNFAVTFFGMLSPTSSEGIRVTDNVFDGVQVRVFEATRGSDNELKRSVVYIHGGGWSLGSARMQSYDYLCRKMAEDLNAVVVSVDYRLAPEVHFPEQYNDAYLGTKHFLLPEVLAKYSVDPNRVAVSGDSAGGNLAAAVSQQECPQCPLHFQPWLTVNLEATKTQDDTSYSVRTGHKHRLTSPTARDCKQSKENSNEIHTVEARRGNICQVFSGNFPSE